MTALFFKFDARTGLASGKVTNRLPVDFLDFYVQTMHTAERGAFASALVSLNFFRNLLLAGTDDGSVFQVPKLQQNTESSFVVVLVRRLRPNG
jgi:hypothetical protein